MLKRKSLEYKLLGPRLLRYLKAWLKIMIVLGKKMKKESSTSVHVAGLLQAESWPERGTHILEVVSEPEA